MTVFVCSGADSYSTTKALDAHCPPGIDRESFDLDGGEHGVVDVCNAAATRSLFGPGRQLVVRGVETLTASDAGRLCETLVVAETDAALHIARRGPAFTVFAKQFDITTFNALKPAELPARVKSIAGNFGVGVDGDGVRTLAGRCGGDLWRVESFFRALQAAGVSSVKSATVGKMFADTTGGVGPWVVAEQVEANNLDVALDLVRTVDAHAMCAWLSGQLYAAARCREAGAVKPNDAVGVLGGSAWAAKRPLAWSQLQGLDRLRSAVLEAEIGMRGERQGSDVARRVVAQLAAELAAR